MERFLVVGGGPAGCTVALTLARAGKDVVLVEKTTYQGLRVGELLSPQGQQILRQVLPDKVEEFFLTAIGTSGCWEEPGLSRYTTGDWWSLDRTGLDHALAMEARASGARILTGTRVENLQRQGAGWTYQVEGRNYSADWVFDATGRASKVARSQGAEVQRFDRQIALVAFLEGPCHAPKDMMLEATYDGWWYAAPIDDNSAVTVFLTDGDLDKGDAMTSWQRRFEASLEVSKAFSGMKPTQVPIRVNAGFSLTLPIYGEGWVAVGESAACFDPLSNLGIGRAAELGQLLAEEFVAAAADNREPDLLGYSEKVGMEFHTHFRFILESYRRVRRFPGSVYWSRRVGATEDQSPLRVRAGTAPDKPLLFPKDQHFECTHCGNCCGAFRRSYVALGQRQMLLKSEPAQKLTSEGYRPLQVTRDGSLLTSGSASKECLFHIDDRCSLYDNPARPRNCSQFPFLLRDTPEGIVVGLSFECPSVQKNEGRPLVEFEDELKAMVAERPPFVLPKLVQISWGRGIPWSRYRDIEDELLSGSEAPEFRIVNALWRLGLWLLGRGDSIPDSRAPGEQWPALQGSASCNFVAQMEFENPKKQVDLHAALLSGTELELSSTSWRGTTEDLRQPLDSPRWYSERSARFVEALIYRKFLLNHGPVYHNLCILLSVWPILGFYTAVQSAARGAAVAEEEDFDRALALMERRLTGPGRYRIKTAYAFRLFLDHVGKARNAAAI